MRNFKCFHLFASFHKSKMVQFSYSNGPTISSFQASEGGGVAFNNSRVSNLLQATYESKGSALQLPFKRIPPTSNLTNVIRPQSCPASSGLHSLSLLYNSSLPKLSASHISRPRFIRRYLATVADTGAPDEQQSSPANMEMPPRIKFKRLDKTARHIMQILDKEAVQDVKTKREIPDIRPGYIIQLKVEVPENKRRVSLFKGIVIARRNAGLNTTFRLRRLVAGVGIESVFPLYSPNIKEVKVLDKKKVKRAKLYYLRDQMTNALKKK